jgi:hypothetical protein
MTLQRHTGTHIALPPIADVPLSPDAEKKSEQTSNKLKTDEPCEAEGGTQD